MRRVMGAMVSINRLLEQTVEHLEAGNPEQAEATLDVLDFERLLHPIKGSGAEHRFVDPALPSELNACTKLAIMSDRALLR